MGGVEKSGESKRINNWTQIDELKCNEKHDQLENIYSNRHKNFDITNKLLRTFETFIYSKDLISQKAAYKFIDELKHGNEEDKAWAKDIVKQLKADEIAFEKQILEALKKFANKKEKSYKRNALALKLYHMIPESGRKADMAVNVLLKTINDENKFVRMGSIIILGKTYNSLEENKRNTVYHALSQAENDRDDDVRDYAQEELSKLEK